eukprot:CAMPEP_0117035142 /NCGR_PEP_ID=MMETSP0472-20121206/24973_1 /TAXON_ID=693140 ORGANISM="Tiarina fusus, Strain LIS" /NCGR_SAMPLE_ID=MMETSP0472 /ASSEMBLY_ACC=CAM_ASM_000603 /LENGTH=353 /DNA_ID=CAMNT_0004744517 /DNA_START=124 /DNA_END=1182 /DNA_ORIENTATION=+
MRFLRALENTDDATISSLSSSSSTHHHHNYTDLSQYYPREGNSSITTSVTIHVTPEHYHLVSWSCLWAGFILAIAFASYQVWLEQKYFAARDLDRTNDGEQATVSTSDITRSRFRRLLLLAMSARTVMIPVQIWSDPLWAQFVADTLPEMAFASAWTLLVSFFVQLVGIASGTGNTTSTGMVIQMTSYVVYVMLVATYFWNPLASVLLYALLCCIYAALLGTTLFFCPRLLTLLQPSLQRQRGLSVRLLSCTALCVFVFGGRTIGFARKVVAPPRQVSWWWQYGALELIPAVLFLVMMHRRNADGRGSGSGSAPSSGTNTPNGSHSGGGGRESMQHRRQGSHGSGKHSRTGET